VPKFPEPVHTIQTDISFEEKELVEFINGATLVIRTVIIPGDSVRVTVIAEYEDEARFLADRVVATFAPDAPEPVANRLELSQTERPSCTFCGASDMPLVRAASDPLTGVLVCAGGCAR
jgi:hypothetical protein